ncbi:HD domain-containing protein [Gulosibacter chungangensis]|uniref:Metal-dependent phosphohydrolase n=1 Tax=Gulosibacter chungangensis TaxID=979746 RepID=A0A7J5B7A1_9MICO|nr:metal-dependent phosphohydrolase [Gulosibacter chungangensis]KAB1640561.1 metal-dependent phosphohydrolase [Gulosibacter chungangensis]
MVGVSFTPEDRAFLDVTARELELPQSILESLLRRWQEPHRNYHGVTHLRSGLQALEKLGGKRLERIAFWCHDAVHTNTTPEDELASVEVARAVLGDALPASEFEEVCRLILVTIDHAPERRDIAGARIADADLVGLASDWAEYCANVEGIRVELPDLEDAAWRERRLATVGTLLRHEPLFHTELGRSQWQSKARENLSRERAELEAS